MHCKRYILEFVLKSWQSFLEELTMEAMMMALAMAMAMETNMEMAMAMAMARNSNGNASFIYVALTQYIYTPHTKYHHTS